MKVLVLLSGGQDSTTSLFWAKHVLKPSDGSEVELHALSVYYGQRHLDELVAARAIAIKAGCKSHFNLRGLDVLFDGTKSAMVTEATSGRNDNVLTLDGGMKDSEAPNGLPSSFLPGRNLMLLAAAACRAGAIGANVIVTGVCQTDYSGYPDCRQDFIDSMQDAINEAWPNQTPAPVIHTPLMLRTKAETVLLATTLPGCMEALSFSVTCYNGKRPGCGTCASCVLRAKGFAEAGIEDPHVHAREATDAELGAS